MYKFLLPKKLRGTFLMFAYKNHNHKFMCVYNFPIYKLYTWTIFLSILVRKSKENKKCKPETIITLPTLTVALARLNTTHRNQIVFTIFRLFWKQTDVRLDPN